MSGPSGTGREYPPELVHGELCNTRFGMSRPCDCGKESEPAPACGHDPAQFVTSTEGTSYCPACEAAARPSGTGHDTAAPSMYEGTPKPHGIACRCSECAPDLPVAAPDPAIQQHATQQAEERIERLTEALRAAQSELRGPKGYEHGMDGAAWRAFHILDGARAVLAGEEDTRP